MPTQWKCGSALNGSIYRLLSPFLHSRTTRRERLLLRMLGSSAASVQVCSYFPDNFSGQTSEVVHGHLQMPRKVLLDIKAESGQCFLKASP